MRWYRVLRIAPTATWLILAVFALLFAPLVHAGGVAVVLDAQPANVEAGTAFTVSFLVRSAHEDRTPITGLSPLIRLVKLGSEELVTATATAAKTPGHYTASITLPSAGEWRWSIQPFGNDEEGRSTQQPIHARSPGEAARPVPAPPTGPIQDAKASENAAGGQYEPREMEVAAGTTIRWHNSGKLPHTVTATDGMFASGAIEPGKTFAYTFAEPGTYAYYCEYHGSANGQGQYGTIKVAAAQAKEAAAAAQAPADQSAESELNQVAAGYANEAPTQALPAAGENAVPTSVAVVIALGLLLLGGLILRRRTQRS